MKLCELALVTGDGNGNPMVKIVGYDNDKCEPIFEEVPYAGSAAIYEQVGYKPCRLQIRDGNCPAKKMGVPLKPHSL